MRTGMASFQEIDNFDWQTFKVLRIYWLDPLKMRGGYDNLLTVVFCHMPWNSPVRRWQVNCIDMAKSFEKYISWALAARRHLAAIGVGA